MPSKEEIKALREAVHTVHEDGEKAIREMRKNKASAADISIKCADAKACEEAARVALQAARVALQAARR